jgi:hypothetical protein
MLLEKVSIHREKKFYLFIVTSFFLLLLVQSLQSSYFLVFYHFGFETMTLTLSHIIDFDDATNLFLNKYIHAR